VISIVGFDGFMRSGLLIKVVASWTPSASLIWTT
jgi:hypothetical protein